MLETKDKAIIFFLVGILVSAPLFFLIGKTVERAALRGEMERLEERYELTSKALDSEIARNKDLQNKMMYLESTVKKLSTILETVYESVREIKNTGENDGIRVTAASLYVVDPSFCITVEVENESNLQRTINIAISGQGVEGKEKEITLYPEEERNVEICGYLRDVASEAFVYVNGRPTVSTVMVLK